jgi:hypothetical protein
MFKPTLVILAFVICLIGCTYPKKKQIVKDLDKFDIIIDSVNTNADISFITLYKDFAVLQTSTDSFFTYNIIDNKPTPRFDSLLNCGLHFSAFLETNDSLIGHTQKDDYYLNNNSWVKIRKHTFNKHTPIFEDSLFKITSSCEGEFGGAVFFTDKQTLKVYSCPATCATTINTTTNGAYYVTSSLNHMSGWSYIVRVKDPTKLYELKNDSLVGIPNWYDGYITNQEPPGYQEEFKKFEVGTEDIFNTRKNVIVNTIMLDSILYGIYNTYPEGTHLGKIINDTIVSIKKLSSTYFNISTLDGCHYKNGKYYTVLFDHFGDRYAILTVNKNKIKLLIFVAKLKVRPQ